MAKRNRPTKRVSQVQKDYQRERRRILRRIADYKRQGLIVDLDVPDIPKRITQGSVRRLQKITLKKIRSKTKAPDLETGEVVSYEEYARRKRRNRRRKKALPPSEGEQTYSSEVPPSPPVDQNVSRETIDDEVAQVDEISAPTSVDQNVSRETSIPTEPRFPIDELPYMEDEIISNFRARYVTVNEWGRSIIFQWLDLLLDRYEKGEVAAMLQAAAQADVLPEGRELYSDEIYTALMRSIEFLDIAPGRRDELFDALEFDENFAEE